VDKDMKYSFLSKVVIFCSIIFVGSGCSTPKFDYSNYKQSKPRSILILPPINESVEVAGETAVLSSLVRPVAEAGYYVMPTTLVSETFKQNGYTQSAEIHKLPLNKLDEIFGADAILYVTIKQYGQKYFVVGSSAIVALEARLVDAKSGQEIWKGSASANSNENNSGNSAGLVGLLVEAVVTQVIGDAFDASYPTSKIATARMLSPQNVNALLYGPRHPKSAF
jgi:hypothetical protein|tara:strand:- start:1856 stop:2524 length:669 start_codon:yes stop_codon:yes gene_type:complete